MPNLLRSPLVRLSLISLATAALFAPSSASAQLSTRVRTIDYETCASSLTDKGIADIDAADACAAALYPQDLAQCVSRIDDGTEITAIDALSGCRQVRRPLELATCVNEIDDAATDTESFLVLDNCRRSLLPIRYSACVVGLSREIDFSTPEALETCIAAGDRPRNVLPSFIPAAEGLTPVVPSVEPLPAPETTP